MAQDVTAVSVKIVWSPPEEPYQNGIITNYTICYQEALLRTNCDRKINVSADQRSYHITDLSPNTEYVLQVKAATVVGTGPPGAVYVMTLSSGRHSLYHGFI